MKAISWNHVHHVRQTQILKGLDDVAYDAGVQDRDQDREQKETKCSPPHLGKEGATRLDVVAEF